MNRDGYEQKSMPVLPRRFLVLLLVVFCVGCASAPLDRNYANPDPMEGFNRVIFKFNQTLDKFLLRPISVLYDRAIPDFIDRGIRNIFANLGEPINTLNLVLQGKPRKAAVSSLRFLTNTTLGVGGIFDVALKLDLQPQREDFGQTLAVWGIPSGPYLMLPFLGPRTLRGSVGTITDNFSSPLQFMPLSLEERLLINTTQIISARAGIISMEETLVRSDEYSFLRDSYLQAREFQINDGLIIEDPFLDEDFHEDEDAP